MTFPEGFGWGATVSATDAWGSAPASDLAAWPGELGAPEAGTPEAPGAIRAVGEDLTRLAGLGLGHVRLTIDWARVEPAEGRRDVEAVEHLRLALAAGGDAGLAMWGCLHDGPLPGWFAQDERGFGDTRSRHYYWARHVEWVGETFGDLIHGWVPVAEPTRWAQRGWLTGDRPPGRVNDAEAFAAALEAIHLASVEAALRLRQDAQPVATAQWLVPLFPARIDPAAPTTPDAEAMTSVAEEVFRGCWLRMLTEETLVVPGRPPVDVPGAREAFDHIGFTYRHALAVRGDGALVPYPQTLATGSNGQVPWAEGLEIVLHRLADAVPERPLFIAGVGLATVDEEEREEYLRDVLAVAEEAIDGGIDVRGLWWETPIDAPTGPARGLLDRDHNPRPAADLLTRVAAGGEVPT
ncbi:MAG: family 1 glycosylhydrolase [Acidimicrobiales bacterium]